MYCSAWLREQGSISARRLARRTGSVMERKMMRTNKVQLKLSMLAWGLH
jgi:hypothetical protein